MVNEQKNFLRHIRHQRLVSARNDIFSSLETERLRFYRWLFQAGKFREDCA